MYRRGDTNMYHLESILLHRVGRNDINILK